jgi:toxin FitB
MFLIDTNVISEIRKGQRANISVRAWFEKHDQSAHFLSVLTIGEIRRGVEQIRSKDPSKAAVYDSYLAEILNIFDGRILGIGIKEAEIWGRLNAVETLPEVDGLMAATAIVHDLTVVTRNIKDFHRSGAKVMNPWE